MTTRCMRQRSPSDYLMTFGPMQCVGLVLACMSRGEDQCVVPQEWAGRIERECALCCLSFVGFSRAVLQRPSFTYW